MSEFIFENRIISEGELSRLLSVTEKASKESVRDRRRHFIVCDHYMILLASVTGLRISEVAGIRIEDISENTIKVLGKGARLGHVVLGRRGRAAVSEYIEIKRSVYRQSIEPGEYLFVNRLYRQYTRFQINKRFSHWTKAAGVRSSLTFHCLRHFYITYLIENGIDLSMVRKLARHRNIETTARYMHLTENTQKKIQACL